MNTFMPSCFFCFMFFLFYVYVFLYFHAYLFTISLRDVPVKRDFHNVHAYIHTHTNIFLCVMFQSREISVTCMHTYTHTQIYFSA